ncbi:MAG: hypothetical protein WCD81_05465 [Candidatus Bathyarchaeia archaeon]
MSTTKQDTRQTRKTTENPIVLTTMLPPPSCSPPWNQHPTKLKNNPISTLTTKTINTQMSQKLSFRIKNSLTRPTTTDTANDRPH